MEQLHRSSPSTVYVRAVGIHQPRQPRILDTGRLLWYIVFSEFNVCQQLEGSYLRAGQQAIEFAAVFYQHSRIAPQTCTKLHPRSSNVKAIAAFQTAVVIACDPVLPRHRSGHDLLHRHQGILRPRQGRVRPDLRHLPAVSGEILRRGITADRKSAVLSHRTALFFFTGPWQTAARGL